MLGFFFFIEGVNFYISISENRNWLSNQLTAREGKQIDHKKA